MSSRYVLVVGDFFSANRVQEPTAQSRQEIEEMIKYYERLLASYQALLDTLGVAIVAGQGQTGEHEDASEHVLVLTNAHKSGVSVAIMRACNKLIL
jgi:hypothetical protein